MARTQSPGEGSGRSDDAARGGREREGSGRGADRGLAPLLGLVLIAGIVAASVTLVVVLGEPVLESGQREVEVAKAESAMRTFDREAEGVAASGRPARIDLGLGDGGGVARTDDGWLRVTVTTAGRSRLVENRSLGALVYENGPTTVGYQGGGVFGSDDGRAVLLSAPAVTYTDETLSVSLLSLSGDREASGVARVERGDSYPAFPERSTTAGATLSGAVGNPLSTAEVAVTVRSRYYEAWGRYFQARTPGYVAYDHRRERVTVVLRSLQPPLSTSGIIATARSGDLSLEGTGAYTDSYDSSAGTYAATRSAGGTVQAAGDLTMDGDATLLGDVEIGGEVSLGGTAQVEGDVGWTEDYDASASATVTGSVRRIDGVASLPPAGEVVRRSVDRLRRRNDNGDTAALENERLSIDGDSAELGPGSYYLEEFDLQGRVLVINATGGDVEIGVENWVRVVGDRGSDGRIRVVGEGDVRLLVASRESVTVSPTGLGSRDVHLHVGKGSTVRVPGHDASQFLVFGPGSFHATVAGSSGDRVTLDGVVYAPAGTGGSGSVYVKQADVFGAVVTGDLTLGQYGAVHFDRSIASRDRRAGPSEIDFLHVAVRELLLSD